MFSSTVYVPKHIRNLIASVDASSIVQLPYDPKLIHRDDSHINPFIKKVLELYRANQCYLMPIVNQSKLVGFIWQLT